MNTTQRQTHQVLVLSILAQGIAKEGCVVTQTDLNLAYRVLQAASTARVAEYLAAAAGFYSMADDFDADQRGSWDTCEDEPYSPVAAAERADYYRDQAMAELTELVEKYGQ